MYRIGIDIGGAFTDLVAIDENGNMVSVKVDTTREQAEGVMNSVRASGIDLRQVRDIIHGHTVVINSIVQRDVATVGLVTTKGFRDVLEIQRSNRRDIYNLRYRKPELRATLSEAGGRWQAGRHRVRSDTAGPGRPFRYISKVQGARGGEECGSIVHQQLREPPAREAGR